MTCGVPRFSAVKTGPRTALGDGRQCHPGGPPVGLRPGEVLRLAGANRRVQDCAGRKSRSWPGSASATAAALNAAALAEVSAAGDQVIAGCPPGRSDVM